MTDFVLEQSKLSKPKELANFEFNVLKLKAQENYANFLNQPLTLGMFVPCDLDGNVLEEPTDFKQFLYNTDSSNPTKDYYILNGKSIDEYYHANENILFDGFTLLFNENGISHVKTNRVFIGIGHLKGLHKTVEDLVKHDLELTESAKKQIGL